MSLTSFRSYVLNVNMRSVPLTSAQIGLLVVSEFGAAYPGATAVLVDELEKWDVLISAGFSAGTAVMGGAAVAFQKIFCWSIIPLAKSIAFFLFALNIIERPAFVLPDPNREDTVARRGIWSEPR